jgi:hypothetical protein
MARALLVLILATCASARAGDPVLLLHATAPDYGGCSGLTDANLRCNGLTPDGAASAQFVWLVVGDAGADLGGILFGITYDSGIGSPTWNLCTGGAQIPFEPWPASGGGLAVAWPGGCYNVPGDFAKVGFFSVGAGASGVMTTRTHPETETMTFVRCDTSIELDLCPFSGSVAFGDLDGYVPADCECSGPPVRERTWSRIKESYR